MQKIDVTQIMVDLRGEPMMAGTQTGERCPACGQPIVTAQEELTLRTVCIEALTFGYDDEKGLSAEKKIGRATLAQRIFDEDEPEILAKEIALLQKLVNKRYRHPLIVRQAHTWLEGKESDGD